MILQAGVISDIIAHRLQGCGVRQTAELCRVHRDTVVHWSLVVGEGCARLLDRLLVQLAVLRLELDELHTTVNTKQRHLAPAAPAEYGDTWLYLGECVTSRAIVSYRLGKRDFSTTDSFITDLRHRVVGRPSITTDGYTAYLTAIARVFRGDVDLATVLKEYESAIAPSGRRCAEMFVRAKRIARLGKPVLGDCSTSHVERLNATVRLRLSQFGRRSLRQAKSFRHLAAAVALFVAGYDLVWVHSTTKKTPAQALGIADRPWSVDELVEIALHECKAEVVAQSELVANTCSDAA